MRVNRIDPERNANWEAYGLCVPEDPTLWDGVRTTRSRYGPLDFSVAREICGQCTVSNLCLARALDTRDDGCMRGGKTPAELTGMIKELEKPPIERARVMA